MRRLDLELLGGFAARVDGVAVPAGAWTGRASDLVKLLALAPGHRLPRDRVVDALWPRLRPDAGAANLHKAAHLARRALGSSDAVVLRRAQVLLAPDVPIATDVERFEATGDPRRYVGDLLPEDRYADWTQERREELRARWLAGLRDAGRWRQVAEAEPTDEAAQQALMRDRLAAGDRPGALRAFERLATALAAIGLRPSVETLVLHGRIAGGAALDAALTAVQAELEAAPLSERSALLATRADLLLAVGDPGAPAAYAAAAAAAADEATGLRIRQAWAHLATGDPGAALATLANLRGASGGEEAARLIAHAAASWFSGDVEGARRAAIAAPPLALSAGLAAEARTAVQIQAMIAHSAGEWPAALTRSLNASLRAPDLAETLFDGHLCVGEYALTSGEPHDRIRTVAMALHARAVRTGARRARSFAATLLGEIELIAGRVAEADRHLRDAVRVSRGIGATSAEALASARLGEAARAAGDIGEGERLLGDALVLSGWSPLRDHLQALVYAALLRGTDDPDRCAGLLDDADAALRDRLVCAYCGHAFRVAAALAAARAGRLDRAEAALARAEATAALWSGGPWGAALEEVRGEIAGARGRRGEARSRLRLAADELGRLGWRLEAGRVAARAAVLA